MDDGRRVSICNKGSMARALNYFQNITLTHIVRQEPDT